MVTEAEVKKYLDSLTRAQRDAQDLADRKVVTDKGLIGNAADAELWRMLQARTLAHQVGVVMN